MSETDIETLTRPGGIVPVDVETTAGLVRRVLKLHAAATLGLEALRKVSRYGIGEHGEQYTGWKALPSGIAMPATQMSKEDAARLLASEAVMTGDSPDDVIRPWGQGGKGYDVLLRDPEEARKAYKLAAKSLHPDVGGDAGNYFDNFVDGKGF